MTKSKYYVVWKGRETGIFDNWKECENTVKGYENPRFKSFNDKKIAELAYGLGPDKNIWEHIPEDKYNELCRAIKLPDLDSISVDAACSGNPGIMEYRGVMTRNGKVLFSQGPFEDSTVNIGEFLAIVHGLSYLKKKKSNMPVYTDSNTAMKWLKDKHVNTRLEKTLNNKILFEYVSRALTWLRNHHYNNHVLKWDTATWGEIPADYGRK